MRWIYNAVTLGNPQHYEFDFHAKRCLSTSFLLLSLTSSTSVHLSTPFLESKP